MMERVAAFAPSSLDSGRPAYIAPIWTLARSRRAATPSSPRREAARGCTPRSSSSTDGHLNCLAGGESIGELRDVGAPVHGRPRVDDQIERIRVVPDIDEGQVATRHRSVLRLEVAPEVCHGLAVEHPGA